MKEMCYCKLCKQKNKYLKKVTLGQACVTYWHTYSEELSYITVEEMKKEQRLTDRELANTHQLLIKKRKTI